MHAEEKLPAVEVVMTMLHAGGEVRQGRLQGLGRPARRRHLGRQRALGMDDHATSSATAFVWEMKFERGVTVQKLKKIGRTEGTGTLQWFKPDPEIFEVTEFHWDILQKRLRELAFLNRGLVDHAARRARRRAAASAPTRSTAASSRSSSGSTRRRIRSIRSSRRTRERDGVDVEVAMQYTDAYTEQIFSYANNINTIEGGMHLQGFRHRRHQRGQRLRAQARHAQGVRQLALDRRLH